MRSHIAPSAGALVVALSVVAAGCTHTSAPRVLGAVVQRVPDTTTTASIPTTTTTTTEPTTSTTMIRPARHIAPPTTTSTTIVCLNSFDPACGPFRWETDPGPNAPLTVAVTVSNPNPKVGEEIVIHFDADDPDATIAGTASEDYGDAAVSSACSVRNGRGQPHGAWSVPARAHGHESQDIPHSYNKPGRYTIRIVRSSGGCDAEAPTPYGSVGEGIAEVDVSG